MNTNKTNGTIEPRKSFLQKHGSKLAIGFAVILLARGGMALMNSGLPRCGNEKVTSTVNRVLNRAFANINISNYELAIKNQKEVIYDGKLEMRQCEAVVMYKSRETGTGSEQIEYTITWENKEKKIFKVDLDTTSYK